MAMPSEVLLDASQELVQVRWRAAELVSHPSEIFPQHRQAWLSWLSTKSDTCNLMYSCTDVEGYR